MDWPEFRLLHPRLLTAADHKTTSTPASGTWPLTNKAIYLPLRVIFPFVVRQFVVANGATAGNNFDIGLYSRGGTLIVSSGSTAMAGTTDCQAVDVTDFLLTPEMYYLAIAFNGTTATMMRLNPNLHLMKACGVAVQTSAFPLPATATMAANDGAYWPLIGLLGDAAL